MWIILLDIFVYIGLFKIEGYIGNLYESRYPIDRINIL